MKVELSHAAKAGIELCKMGFWDEGILCLDQAVVGEEQQAGSVLGYLGYGIAFRQNRVKEGLELCEEAVSKGFYDADNYMNLARVLLLQQRKRSAVRVILQGLAVERDHRGLQHMMERLGLRRPPVVPFLRRSNAINVTLGRIRHRILGDLKPQWDQVA